MSEDRYQYPEQDGSTVEMTRSEILKQYYPWWSEQMKKVGKEHLISEDNCIEDFIVVNWAHKVEEKQ